MFKELLKFLRSLIAFANVESERSESMRMLLDNAVYSGRSVWIYFKHGEGAYAGKITKNMYEPFYVLLEAKGGLIAFHHSSISIVYTPPANALVGASNGPPEKKSVN